MDERTQEGEDITRPEVTANYVRIPVAPKQKGDVLRTITISAKDGIKALYAVNRKLIVTYLFQKSNGWTMSKAKTWIKEHHKSEKSLIEKSMKNVSRFNFAIPVLKARSIFVKDADGNEVEERFLEGVASSTDLDLHGDKMAPSAIESMAESIKQHAIMLNAEHDKSWQSELGEVTKFEVTDDYKLVMEAKLDKVSKADDLWYALTEKKSKLGLSIGGFVKDFKIEVDEESGDWQRTFTNIELDHVAVVSSPANPKTWVSAISKSLEGLKLGKVEEEPITNKQEEIIMDKKTPLETEVKKDEEVVETPPAEETTVTPETGKEVVAEEETPAETKVEETPAETVVEEPKETPAEETKEETTIEETPAEIPAETPEETKVEEETKEEAVEEKEEEETEKKVEEKQNVEEVNLQLKNEEITKTLSTLNESLKEVLKSNEVLIKQNLDLVKRVDALENQPAGRKVSVDKGMGSNNGTSTEGKTLSEALKEAESKFKGGNGLFAEKQKIRAEYAAKGILE